MRPHPRARGALPVGTRVRRQEADRRARHRRLRHRVRQSDERGRGRPGRPRHARRRRRARRSRRGGVRGVRGDADPRRRHRRPMRGVRQTLGGGRGVRDGEIRRGGDGDDARTRQIHDATTRAENRARRPRAGRDREVRPETSRSERGGGWGEGANDDDDDDDVGERSREEARKFALTTMHALADPDKNDDAADFRARLRAGDGGHRDGLSALASCLEAPDAEVAVGLKEHAARCVADLAFDEGPCRDECLGSGPRCPSLGKTLRSIVASRSTPSLKLKAAAACAMWRATAPSGEHKARSRRRTPRGPADGSGRSCTRRGVLEGLVRLLRKPTKEETKPPPTAAEVAAAEEAARKKAELAEFEKLEREAAGRVTAPSPRPRLDRMRTSAPARLPRAAPAGTRIKTTMTMTRTRTRTGTIRTAGAAATASPPTTAAAATARRSPPRTRSPPRRRRAQARGARRARRRARRPVCSTGTSRQCP